MLTFLFLLTNEKGEHFNDSKKADHLLFTMNSRMLPAWFPNENPILHLILRKRPPIIEQKTCSFFLNFQLIVHLLLKITGISKRLIEPISGHYTCRPWLLLVV